MDGLSEKFSVFDFFNPIIAGMIFLLSQGIALYPLYKMDTINWESIKDFQIIIIVGVLTCAYTIGAVLYSPTHYVITNQMKYETRMIENCLNSSELFSSADRRKKFVEKAMEYLGDLSSCLNNNKEVGKEQCSAFFAHCVYYLQLKKIDGKCERLRETQALSELLSGVFATAVILDIFIVVLFVGNILTEAERGVYVAICAIVWLTMCIGFYKRYKMAVKNRIRIVISLYDASIDMEKAAHA